MAQDRVEDPAAAKERGHQHRVAVVTAFVTFAGTLISSAAVVVAAIIAAPDAVRDALGDRIAVTTTATATVTMTTTATAVPSATRDGEQASAGTGVVLSANEAVTDESCGSLGGNAWEDGTALLGGETTPAPGMTCLVSQRGAMDGSMDFVVPQGAITFTAKAGIDRESANGAAQVEFSVVALDGRVLDKQVATYTESPTVTAQVADTSRITLKILVLKGNSTSTGDSFRLAWISPKFQTGP
ncbi:NPCBM/NEW2 domain-containing protein [Nonomuraea solani]|uniref:NPCBM/NEW2 domain-containing protein n=1 Tax=Nonomuraea solani TaxID=1144553 RepID=A0A1H6DVC7_9ACTN|nr:NPCBM/NEW2 domain-containing protein [Nonomuraea solani]SEG89004.1 NPCBM/NEW2 domain-containing protein [Nonomuraea solani]